MKGVGIMFCMFMAFMVLGILENAHFNMSELKTITCKEKNNRNESNLIQC